MPKKISRAKLLVLIGTTIWMGAIFLVITSQVLFSNREEPGRYSLTEIILIGISLIGAAIAGGLLSLKAWIKNADEYDNWFTEQRFFEPLISETSSGAFARKIHLWVARLVGPIIVMMSMFIPILFIWSVITRLITP